MHAAIIGAKRYVTLKTIAITSCQVLIFYGWVNQLPHDSIAAHRASNRRLFGCGSYALINYTIAGSTSFKTGVDINF